MTDWSGKGRLPFNLESGAAVAFSNLATACSTAAFSLNALCNLITRELEQGDA